MPGGQRVVGSNPAVPTILSKHLGGAGLARHLRPRCRGIVIPSKLENACTASVPVAVPAGGKLTLRARIRTNRGTIPSRLHLFCDAS